VAPDPIRSWYGHAQHVGRKKYVLLLHAETRFCVLLRAKGVLSAPALQARWKDALPRCAEVAGLTADLVSPLLTESRMRVTKAVDRRVLGTMVDWFRLLHGRHAASGQSLDAPGSPDSPGALDELEMAELSRALNDVPILGGNFGVPRDRLAEFLRTIDSGAGM